jgi:allantoinase
LSDLAVRGGRVVTSDGIVDADILVLSGHITGIVPPDEGDARQEVDARGLVVLPGVVDAHVHVNEPGRTEWEGWRAATRGAAAGGVTTIADMPLNSIPPTIDGDAFDKKYDAASASAIVDFAIWGGLVDSEVERLRELAACGVVGVKAFMCPSGVDEFPHVHDGDALVLALAAATSAGLLVAVHAEDEAIVAVTTDHVRRSGRRDARAWLDSRPIEAERVAIGGAARRTGASVHVVHASSHEALRAVDGWKGRGADITVETCPHYLTFDAADVDAVGPALKCAPPIRDGERERLWSDLATSYFPDRSRVDYVASDHSPCAAALKRRGEDDIFEAWGGVSGLQSLLPVMLTEGVRARRLGLPELAQLVSTRPAKRLGIWPRKGEIQLGADADLVLVDLDREWTFTQALLETKSGISPYVGRRFHGAVTRTIVRGRTVFRDGKVEGEPGDGWFVQRVNL